MNSLTKNIFHVEDAVLRILAYYHIFHHPLKANEIKERLILKNVGMESLKSVLQELSERGIIENKKQYYFLKDDPKIIKNREEGELRAKKLMKVALKMSKIIYLFPFVRGIFISGSLSKGTVPEDADIDYFIITKRNRLWIARTLLVMFKRIFLFGSKKYFCVNYFVDEDNLEIPDKNIFTATEVSTVIPLKGRNYCEKFMSKNSWYKEFYPNVQIPESNATDPGFIKKVSQSVIEAFFVHKLAERLDKSFMKKTYTRWTNMYGGGYSDEEFELAFRSNRGTSKNHDKNYQKKVLNAVEQNVSKALSQIKTQNVNG